MSNSLYDAGRALLLGGSINWASTAIDAYLINTAYYTPNISSDTNISGVSGSAIVAGPVALSSQSIVGGAASAANVTFSSVTGATASGILLCVHSTGALLLWMDTASGLPITPNGGNIIIVWDTGTNHIFKP